MLRHRDATAFELINRVSHHDFRPANIGRCPGIQLDVLKERGDNADVPLPGRIPAVVTSTSTLKSFPISQATR
jgi:hypothetical protein